MDSVKMMSAQDLISFGFSRAAAYQLFNRDDFPTVKIGRRLFVRSDRLMEWLEEHEEAKAAS